MENIEIPASNKNGALYVFFEKEEKIKNTWAAVF